MRTRKSGIFLNIFSLILALVLNFLAVSLPLNGLTTKEISDSFDIYFVPADYVFSIWSIIYIGLIAFVIFQSLPAQRENVTLGRLDKWFLVSNIANAFWLVAFHYRQFALALALIFVLFFALMRIHMILDIDHKTTGVSWRWLVEMPFGIYYGWVTVASISNLSQVLEYYQWNGFGIAPEIWFTLVIAVIVIVSGLMVFGRHVLTYNLVIIWALVGIALKFPDVPVVKSASWGGAITVAVLSMVALTIDQYTDRT